VQLATVEIYLYTSNIVPLCNTSADVHDDAMESILDCFLYLLRTLADFAPDDGFAPGAGYV
jgi:hypothetical protein